MNITAKDIINKLNRADSIMSKNPLVGGVGDNLKSVDPNEMALGIETEKEHIGKNRRLSTEQKTSIQADIAKDHLAEIPDYYTRLKAMERDAELAPNKD
jgi:hypothetical protein